MRHYIVTLLKDLPDVEAGFTFSMNEKELKDHQWYLFDSPNSVEISTENYNHKVHQVLRYKDNTEWVSITLDYSKTVQVICPKCNTLGMFSFKDEELERVHDADVTKWYRKCGLECCVCGNKLYTHAVCEETKVYW